jgi:hypothetical protein
MFNFGNTPEVSNAYRVDSRHFGSTTGWSKQPRKSQSDLHIRGYKGAAAHRRADIAPANGYAMVVDGHFKTQFAEEGAAKRAAKELLASYPMLKFKTLRRRSEH